MDYDAKNSNGKPRNMDRRLVNESETTPGVVFENLQAFSDWLTLDLERLEADYQSFSTVRSSRSSVSRSSVGR